MERLAAFIIERTETNVKPTEFLKQLESFISEQLSSLQDCESIASSLPKHLDRYED